MRYALRWVNIILSSLLIFLSGCATSFKCKMVESAVAGALIGGLYGMTRPNYQTENAKMYSAIGAAAGVLAASFYLDPEQEQLKFKKENDELKEKLNLMNKPILSDSGSSLFKSQIPRDLSKLVSPGEWKRYKIDYWVQDPSNQNIWFRQTEMFEVTPPSTF